MADLSDREDYSDHLKEEDGGDSSDVEDAGRSSFQKKENDEEGDADEDQHDGKASFSANDRAAGSKHVLDDDEDDEDEVDEDDEDDDESDEGHVSGREQRPRKKIRRRAVDAFIDREAEVDDDEEDADDDDEEQEIAEGFIENEDAGGLSPDAQRDDRRHRELDQQQNRLAEADAERMAAQFRERYGRSGGAYRGDQKSVPQRLLLPSVDDPSIWGIRCKPGKENEIVFNLLRKQAEREDTVSPLNIISVFTREHLGGYIYIEARKQKDVIDAMSDVVNAYTNKTVLVPVAEMPDLLRVRHKGTALVPGAYVRIRKNNKRYAGDLGRINDISIDNTEAFVSLVPRLDYSNQEELLRKTLGKTADRPPARLFNVADVEKLTGQRLRNRNGDNAFSFNQEEYQDGLLLKNFKIAHLITEPEQVQPTLEEMQAFSAGDSFDLASLGQGLKSRQVNFAIGDTAEVFSGEQTGVYGIVESINKTVVELRTTDDSGLGVISVPTTGLRKKFFPGNQVRVQSGKHAGESGSVVAVDGDTVTLMTNLGKEEVTVFARDVGEVNEVSEIPVVSRFEVRDVVELNATDFGCVVRIENVLLEILMSTGTIRTVKADSIARKIAPNKSSRTTDRNGESIQIADPQSTVREIGGKFRKGRVFNIHLQSVFCHNIEIGEHNGVWVAKNRDVEVEGMSRSKVDFSKQNPNMVRSGGMVPPIVLPKTVGRDKAIGQTIWIRKGPQKGLMGIVTDTTDTTARIEPHNGLKKISVKKELLGFRTQADGPLIGYADFVNARGWRSQTGLPTRDDHDANRPAWARSGDRTPVGGNGPASSYGSGSRTPAWAGGGSRTPAWSAGNGAATPAWAGSGGRTPAWTQGNATPAWNSGSKTPAWATGNATPAWNSGSGSKTPSWQAGNATLSWNQAGSKTPSWQAPSGAKTPSWNTATPRAPSYGTSSSTRDSYTQSSTTGYPVDYPSSAPGVSRGWEDEWANTGRGQELKPPVPPPQQQSIPTPTASNDAAFINPARMAQMQHQQSYTDTPGYLPPSP